MLHTSPQGDACPADCAGRLLRAAGSDVGHTALAAVDDGGRLHGECDRPAPVLSAIALTLRSVATFGRAHSTVIVWEQVWAMVTTGPFRFSANPIHLADASAHLGGSLLVHSWWPQVVRPGVLQVLRG